MYYIDDYENYLKDNKKSKSCISAYLADIDDFESFLATFLKEFEQATESDAANYVSLLKKSGKSNSTINRRIASLKSFYKYLILRGAVEKSPFADQKAQKIASKELVYLSSEEIITLIELPGEDFSGKRDRALLELMYATGIRASELCELDVKDVNLKIGFIAIHNNGKSRMVPIGRPCQYAVYDYLENARIHLLGKKDDCGALFLSYLGERLTRQGIWKILKNYAEKLPFKDKITPQTIRNTFAAHLIQNGADLKSLQELLGHEDIMATKIYLSVAKNRIIDVYDKAFPRA